MKIIDVECSFVQTYLKFEMSSIPNTRVEAISHKIDSRINLDDTQLIDKYPFENIFYQLVKSHCKLFTAFAFVETYIFVAHGRYLS
jgi:hypothetical protein